LQESELPFIWSDHTDRQTFNIFEFIV
jgi:hypothetical protein